MASHALKVLQNEDLHLTNQHDVGSTNGRFTRTNLGYEVQNEVDDCQEGHFGSGAGYGSVPERDLVIFNGTNADDLRDPTRLGLIAAKRYGVASPLARAPKAVVRVRRLAPQDPGLNSDF